MSESQPEPAPLPAPARAPDPRGAQPAVDPASLSLLADPRTIAGETAPRDDDEDHTRSSAEVDPQSNAASDMNMAPAAAAHPSPASRNQPRVLAEPLPGLPPAPTSASASASATRPRLDAASARALSQEARRRSESSRAELEAARSDLEHRTPTRPEGWRTHPLTRRADEAAPAPAEEETPSQIEVLEQLLERRNEMLESKNAELARLSERIDAQAVALDRTRAALEEERQAHTALRAEIENAAAPNPVPTERVDAEPGSAREVAPPVPASTSARGADEAAPPWPAIHDAWLDDQLRRHFGPLGIDRLADWVRQRLEQHPDLGMRPLRILWLGSGGLGPVLPLAEDLAAQLSAPFSIGVIEAPNAAPAGAQPLPEAHPRSACIEALDPAASPDEFARRIEAYRPDLVVSRAFFSEHADAEPWIGALEAAWHQGSELILLERSGLGAEAPTPALTELGDRIWELLPARYVAEANGEAAFENWAEAFATTQPQRARGALQALKQRFPFELTAQFGYLSEVFVATPIGENFTAEIPKDRRFLRQVADLDERRIEAGTAPPLYGVALVTNPERQGN